MFEVVVRNVALVNDKVFINSAVWLLGLSLYCFELVNPDCRLIINMARVFPKNLAILRIIICLNLFLQT